MVERLFLAVPRGGLQFVIVVFPDHTHLLFLAGIHYSCGLCSQIGAFFHDCGQKNGEYQRVVLSSV